MVLLIVLFDAFEELLQSFRAMAETLYKDNGYLPETFVDVGIGRRMQILWFHDVEVLIGHILAFLLVDSHQELLVDDLLGVLVRGDAGVDKLNNFTHILKLQYIGHYFRHDLSYALEVLTFVLDQGTLQELNQILLDYLSFIDCFFTTIKETCQHV